MTKYCKLSKVLYRKLQIHFKIHYTAMTEIKKVLFFLCVRTVFFWSRSAIAITFKILVFRSGCAILFVIFPPLFASGTFCLDGQDESMVQPQHTSPPTAWWPGSPPGSFAPPWSTPLGFIHHVISVGRVFLRKVSSPLPVVPTQPQGFLPCRYLAPAPISSWEVAAFSGAGAASWGARCKKGPRPA